MIYKMWRQDCSTEGFALNYHTPEHFTRCHWQKAERVKPLWIVYRAAIALYFLASFLYTICPIGREIPEENTIKYPIFLTHWTYVLETLQFLLALIIVAVRARLENNKPLELMETLPWYYKLYWILYTVSLPSAITVTVIFWATIYDPVMFPATPANLMEHAFNSIFMLIDFILVAHPIKTLHFYVPATYGFLYGGFSLIYQLSGGTGVKGIIPIYKILDWRTPEWAMLTCFLSLMFLLFLHFTFAALHIFKVWLMKKRSGNEGP